MISLPAVLLCADLLSRGGFRHVWPNRGPPHKRGPFPDPVPNYSEF